MPNPRMLAWRISVAGLCLAIAGICRADKIDDFARQELSRQRIPGMSIAVVKYGKIVKSNGYGYASLDHKVPATSSTVFALASITKQFTATLIMILVEEGKVGLDDKVSNHLPNTPDAWREITVRNLLNHTAGLAPLGQDFVSLVRTMNVSTENMYLAAKSDAMGGSPGEKWSYSDVGYFLLGMIIEKASGKRYEAFLQERILSPLDMKTARMLDLNRPYPNLANGYRLTKVGDSWEIRNIRRDSQRELTSHYGLFGTVSDLAKWDAGLSANGIIKASSFQQMVTPTKLSSGEEIKYGFGWTLANRNGVPYHYHSGITGTYILRVPTVGLAVIVLTNLGRGAGDSSPGADPYLIAHGIASLVEPKFQLKPLKGQDSIAIARMQEAFAAIMARKVTSGVFADDAIKAVTNETSEFPEWYGKLGKVRKLEVVLREEDRGETWFTTRFHFERGSQLFTMSVDKEGKVTGFFPDA